jgi:hypothetical protein
MMDTQMPPDAAEIETIDIQPKGLLAQRLRVALFFGVWSITATAVLALVALAP